LLDWRRSNLEAKEQFVRGADTVTIDSRWTRYQAKKGFARGNATLRVEIEEQVAPILADQPFPERDGLGLWWKNEK